MSYYIYFCYTKPRYVVHKASCRFCNQGQGVPSMVFGERNRRFKPSGRWFGPFNTYYEAVAQVWHLTDERKLTGHPCRHCQPTETGELAGCTESNLRVLH